MHVPPRSGVGVSWPKYTKLKTAGQGWTGLVTLDSGAGNSLRIAKRRPIGSRTLAVLAAPPSRPRRWLHRLLFAGSSPAFSTPPHFETAFPCPVVSRIRARHARAWARAEAWGTETFRQCESWCWSEGEHADAGAWPANLRGWAGAAWRS